MHHSSNKKKIDGDFSGDGKLDSQRDYGEGNANGIFFRAPKNSPLPPHIFFSWSLKAKTNLEQF